MSFEDSIFSLKSPTTDIYRNKVIFTSPFESHSRIRLGYLLLRMRAKGRCFRFFFNPIHSHLLKQKNTTVLLKIITRSVVRLHEKNIYFAWVKSAASRNHKTRVLFLPESQNPSQCFRGFLCLRKFTLPLEVLVEFNSEYACGL